MSVSNQAIVQHQVKVMKLQDEMLEDIEKGVDRLHKQAVDIGEETKIHMKIISELDTHVDDTTLALQAETKRAEQVRLKGQVCYMYICIGLEVAILVIFLLIYLLHPST